MNLSSIANSAIQSILPNRAITLKKYAGFTINEYAERIPSYYTVDIYADIQDLSSSDLSFAEKIGLQGQLRNIYIHAPDNLRANMQGESGGDLVNFDGADWLVIKLVEDYPHYSKAIMQRQSTIQDAYVIDNFLTDDNGNFITQDNGSLIMLN